MPCDRIRQTLPEVQKELEKRRAETNDFLCPRIDKAVEEITGAKDADEWEKSVSDDVFRKVIYQSLNRIAREDGIAPLDLPVYGMTYTIVPTPQKEVIEQLATTPGFRTRTDGKKSWIYKRRV